MLPPVMPPKANTLLPYLYSRINQSQIYRVHPYRLRRTSRVCDACIAPLRLKAAHCTAQAEINLATQYPETQYPATQYPATQYTIHSNVLQQHSTQQQSVRLTYAEAATSCRAVVIARRKKTKQWGKPKMGKTTWGVHFAYWI